MQVGVPTAVRDGSCSAMSGPEESTWICDRAHKISSNAAQMFKFNILVFYTYLTVSFYSEM